MVAYPFGTGAKTAYGGLHTAYFKFQWINLAIGSDFVGRWYPLL